MASLPTKTFKHIAKLQLKKFRREFGEFTVEGVKGVKEALLSDSEIVLLLIEGNKRDEKSIQELIDLANKKGVQVEFVKKAEAEKLKTTETFSGVLAVVEIKEYSLDDLLESAPIICLENVRDPGNLGTIIRTADWFGIKNIIISQNSVDLYNPKTVRGTMGSIFREKFFVSKNLSMTLDNLKKEGYKLVGLDLQGEKMEKMKSEEKAVYIFGNESEGLSQEVEKKLDKRYTITGKGGAESLNLSVSAGILMYCIG